MLDLLHIFTRWLFVCTEHHGRTAPDCARDCVFYIPTLHLCVVRTDHAVSVINSRWLLVFVMTVNAAFNEDKSLFRFNGNTTEQISLFNGYPISGVLSMVEDLNRNIWFSTGVAGIVKYNGVEMQSIKIADGLNDTVVYCSTRDREGNLWFGTNEGGINVYITK